MATTRDFKEGRLFPHTIYDNGWSVSAQADRVGYQCSPQRRFDTLEQYETVEVVVYGPEHWPVDPKRIGLPEGIVAKFTEVGRGPAIGCRLTHGELAAVKRAAMMALMNPNAGVPRGDVVWGGREVYHGASRDIAADILANGIDMSASQGGYFGRAFYVADDAALAKSNYADFSGEEEGGGGVVQFVVADGAHILDMRNDQDQREWDDSGLARQIHRGDFARLARKAGVDGVYDRSVGGLAIYRASALTPLRLEPSEQRGPRP
jgi:hypothetical protein